MRYDNVAIFKDTMEKCGSIEALKTSIESSIEGQTFFAADSQSKAVEERRFASTKLLLQNKRSFQAAVGLEGRVCVHNFASFTHPGGGVAKGSTAQEECLCRISTLYPCLNSDYALSNFYSRHKGFGSPLFNSDVLYTPGVKVFKTDAVMPMTLPENLWYDVDVVTCAAPNLMKVRISDKELLSIHTERLGRIFNAAYAVGADSLVLGAFGCGVFKNNPKIVAQASVEVAGMYDGCFDRIVFAIPASNDNSNYWEFERALK